VVAKSRLPAISKNLKKRAEASVLYHSKHIMTLLEEIQESFEILEAEEKRTDDADVKARIDNERMALQDLVEDLLQKVNAIINKIA
jgi:hypothetical protein